MRDPRAEVVGPLREGISDASVDAAFGVSSTKRRNCVLFIVSDRRAPSGGVIGFSFECFHRNK